jgi:DNA-binding PadR family transcriptional regulator
MLVLGVVRILQPVHGYHVRRELLSWRGQDWMNVQPGSIYSALKHLERDGLIAVDSHERSAGRPERTRYVMTEEGNKEFTAMLRAAFWRVGRSADPFIPALSLMTFMRRDELAAAMQARLGQLQGELDEVRFMRASIRDGATGAEGDVPEHVREIDDFLSARIEADIAWTRQFVERLAAGHYVFAGEPGSEQTAPHWRTAGQPG